MKDKHFIDTNIFVYSFDKSDLQKNDIAQNLISQALINSKGIISYQDIQEFMNVALGKFKVSFRIMIARNIYLLFLNLFVKFIPV